eukprot:gene11579-15507_t
MESSTNLYLPPTTRVGEMMEIEIKYNKGRSDTVLVNYGDDPAELAKEFVARHKLKASSIPIITTYISSTVDQFLANSVTDTSVLNSSPPSIINSSSSASRLLQNDNFMPIYVPKSRQSSPNLESSHLEDTTIPPKSKLPLHITSSERPPIIENSPTTTQPITDNNNHNHSHPIKKYEQSRITNSTDTELEYRSRSPSVRSQSGWNSQSVPLDINAKSGRARSASHSHVPVTQNAPLNENFNRTKLVLDTNPNLSAASFRSFHTPEYYLNSEELQVFDDNIADSNILYKPLDEPFNSIVKSRSPSISGQNYNDHQNFGGLIHDDIRVTSPIDTIIREKSPVLYESTDDKNAISNNYMTEDVQTPNKRLGNRQMSRSFSYQNLAYPLDIFNTNDPLDSSIAVATAALSRSYRNDSFANNEIQNAEVTMKNDLNEHPNTDETFAHFSYPNSRRNSNSFHENYSNLVEDDSDRHNTNNNDKKDEQTDEYLKSEYLIGNSRSRHNSSFKTVRSHQSIPALDNEESVLNTDDDSYYQISNNEYYDMNNDDNNGNYLSDNETNQLPNEDVSYDDDSRSDRSVTTNQTNDPEELYNRLQHKWKQGGSSALTGSKGKVLKPSSSVLLMSTNKKSLATGSAATGISSNNKKSLVGKSTTDRLYNTAKIMEKKRQYHEQKHLQELEQMLAEGQFKLSENSKRIVQNILVHEPSLDFGTRLHNMSVNGGIHNGQTSKKQSEAVNNMFANLDCEWSCSKCATYHTIPISSLQIYRNNNIVGFKNTNDIKKICSNCHFEQSEHQPFKPVNIGLELAEDPEELLRNREIDSGANGAVHEYLHANAKQRENILKLNRTLWEESNKTHTFTPSIPQKSRLIVNKYTHNNSSPTAGGKRTGIISTDSSIETNSHNFGINSPSNYSNGNKVTTGLSGYLNKSATERLSSTLTKSKQLPNQNDANSPSHSQQSNNKNKQIIDEEFVNRLTYEYKAKEKNRQELTEKYTKLDLQTGQVLYQPNITGKMDSHNSSFQQVESIYARKSANPDEFVNELLKKSERLASKKKAAEDASIQNILKEMETNRVGASEQSKQILQKSTEKNIIELFKLLLVSTATNGTDENNNNQDDNKDVLDSGSGDHSESSSHQAIAIVNEKTIALSHYATKQLDLSKIRIDLVIPEIYSLLIDIQHEKAAMIHRRLQSQNIIIEENEEKNIPLIVNFTEFRLLVFKCMKHRNGTGKAYIYAPKKKPEMALQMIRKELKEETFHPQIDKTSEQLVANSKRYNNDVPIE